MAGGESPTSLEVRCGSLFDGVSSKLRKNVLLRIENDRIAGISSFGQGSAARFSPNVVDLSAQTCLPGLTDVHVHIITQDPTRREIHGSASQSLSAGDLMRTLRYGFTTVRNLGTKTLGPSDIDVRSAIAAGLLIGPRLQVASCSTDTRYLGAKSVPTLRATVDRLVKAGSQWIKLFASPGWDYAPQYDATELAAIVDEAHREGARVAIHTVNPEETHSAVAAHVDSIEHGIDIRDADLKLMHDSGIVYVPTMSVLQFVSALPGRNDSAVWIYQLNQSFSTFERALKAKVKIAFGTDAGALDGRYTANPAQQFRLMVQHGMSPIQAILASTHEGPALLNMSDQIGSIQVGKYADVVAVKGNPTSDIAVLEHIVFVMKNGRVIEQPPRR